MNSLEINLHRGFHRQKDVIFMVSPKDKLIIEAIKSIPGAKWSKTNRAWYIPLSDFSLNNVFIALRGIAWVNITALKGKKNDEESANSKQTIQPVPESITPEIAKDIKTFRDWIMQEAQLG